MATTDEVLNELTVRCERLRSEGGDRLPSERALAEELKAARSTVRRALNVLAAKGAITVVRGRGGGTYLADTGRPRLSTQEQGILAIWSADGRNIDRSLNRVAGIPQKLFEQGLDIGVRVLSLALEAPEAYVASQLDIKPDEPVIALSRLRFGDGVPLSVETMYLSFGRFPALLDEGLRGASSVYQLLHERYGVSVDSAEEEIEIAAATPSVAHLLAIDPGDAVLALRRRACDAKGRPLECSLDIFRGDRTRLTVRTHAQKPRGDAPDDGWRPRLQVSTPTDMPRA
jgi:GntR family transcriptional regulator